MFQRQEKKLQKLLKETIETYLKDTAVDSSSLPSSLQNIIDSITLEIPKEKEFGDLSCNIAMRLASVLRKNPRQIASELAEISKNISNKQGEANFVRQIEVKGAGFINIFLSDSVFHELLRSASPENDNFSRLEIGKNQKLLLEFVSANPTGPLSVAHARQAAVGDALTNVLKMAGFDVTKEYYLNDEGNQINILGRSISLRFKELAGETIEFPEDHYQGQYITDLARVLWEDESQRVSISKLSMERQEKFFLEYGVEKILNVIKEELDDFGVHFDVWFSQKTLGETGRIEKVLDYLKHKGLVYDSEGATWFKSTTFGDDKDRVVRKSDGSYTYLAPDIAYHDDKLHRGFKKIIDIWGPDHHGYIPRMKAAIQALGANESAFSVIIVQLATLFRDGQPAPMSTRKGQYVTLREVLTEVGRDASRFFFLMRKTDSHLDFDLELAKKQTSDNPVFYIQYAHARIAGILSAAGEKIKDIEKADLSLLKAAEERDLMKAIFEYSYCLMVCVKQLDPYHLTVYLQFLASSFHRFYDRHKVLSEDENLTQARLFLIRSVKIVLAQGLHVLGVSSPERM